MDVNRSTELINNALNAYTFGQRPEELYDPMLYVLQLDQQRFYSLLTLWGCYLFSGDTKKALSPALGVEVFNGFIMVHQDILNRNLSRDGQDCVHIKWNDNVAILSGDAMIFKAYELLIQIDPTLTRLVIRMFNRCFTKICEGKQLVLNDPGTADDENILKLDPGALTEFCLQLGAAIGGASQQQLEQSGNLGNLLGIMWRQTTKDHQSFSPSHLRFTAVGAAVLQSFQGLDCDEERKEKFKVWVFTKLLS